MESHFVVVYNHKTGKFQIDEGTTQARFSDGNVFDENDGWIYPDEDSKEEESDAIGYNELVEILEKYNKETK